jgi:hypothetical protein
MVLLGNNRYAAETGAVFFFLPLFLETPPLPKAKKKSEQIIL